MNRSARLAIVLALSLLVAMVVASCTGGKDTAQSGLSPLSESDLAAAPPPPDQEAPDPQQADKPKYNAQSGIPEKMKQYDVDVACIPKKDAETAGTNQPDPNEGPPDTMPPPPALPSLDDPTGMSDEGLESGDENGALGEKELPTNRELLKSLKDSDSPDAKDPKVQKQVDKALKDGKVPVCEKEGNWKGSDPGVTGARAAAEENPGSSADQAQVDQAVEKIKAAFTTDSAEAQTTCQPVAITRAGTRASAAEVQSLANAINTQLYYDFRPTWWCAYAYYADSIYNVGSGSWPIYVCGTGSYYGAPGDRCAASPYATGNNHSQGQWPFYPYTNAPWGQVPDSTSGYGTYGTPYYNFWSYSTSHEALEVMSNPWVAAGGWGTNGSCAYVGLGSGTCTYWWETGDAMYNGYLTRGYWRTDSSTGRAWLVTDFALRSFFTNGYGPPWNYLEYFSGSSYRGARAALWGKCDGAFGYLPYNGGARPYVC